MRQDSRIRRAGGSGNRILTASAGLRRQLRLRNIMLAIVGAVATVFIALRTWSGF